MAAVRELHDLGLEVLKPGGAFGKKYVTGLDLCRLRGNASHFVAFGHDRDRSIRLVLPQVLDQMGSRALVLDEDDGRAVFLRLLNDALPELGVFQTLTDNVDQVIAVSAYLPRCADRVIVDLLGFRSRFFECARAVRA